MTRLVSYSVHMCTLPCLQCVCAEMTSSHGAAGRSVRGGAWVDVQQGGAVRIKTSCGRMRGLLSCLGFSGTCCCGLAGSDRLVRSCGATFGPSGRMYVGAPQYNSLVRNTTNNECNTVQHHTQYSTMLQQTYVRSKILAGFSIHCLWTHCDQRAGHELHSNGRDPPLCSPITHLMSSGAGARRGTPSTAPACCGG